MASRLICRGQFVAAAAPGPSTFKQGLRDLGYVEGRNIVIEDRFAKSYGPSFAELNRRAATYVDKILKGAKPADLPAFPALSGRGGSVIQAERVPTGGTR